MHCILLHAEMASWKLLVVSWAAAAAAVASALCPSALDRGCCASAAAAAAAVSTAVYSETSAIFSQKPRLADVISPVNFEPSEYSNLGMSAVLRKLGYKSQSQSRSVFEGEEKPLGSVVLVGCYYKGYIKIMRMFKKATRCRWVC